MSSASQGRLWDVHRLPSAGGRVFLITGGNTGIGCFAAEQLAATGAVVVLGCRDAAKADTAMASIRSRVSDAHVRHLPLDLADLSSLKTAIISMRWSTTQGSRSTPREGSCGGRGPSAWVAYHAVSPSPLTWLTRPSPLNFGPPAGS